MKTSPARSLPWGYLGHELSGEEELFLLTLSQFLDMSVSFSHSKMVCQCAVIVCKEAPHYWSAWR